jgi:F0F1-type ATP synthase epsilon subunit
VTQSKVIVLTDSALGEAEIDEAQVEAAIKRAQEKLAAIDHNLDAEEVAYLQGIITKSSAALHFKRRFRH